MNLQRGRLEMDMYLYQRYFVAASRQCVVRNCTLHYTYHY